MLNLSKLQFMTVEIVNLVFTYLKLNYLLKNMKQKLIKVEFEKEILELQCIPSTDP